MNNDWTYTFQWRFARKIAVRARLEQVGRTFPYQYDLAKLGMQIAAGRFDHYLPQSRIDAILKSLAILAGVGQKLTYPDSGCLYKWKPCQGGESASTPPPTGTTDDVMDFKQDADGKLVLITSTKKFEVPLNHNSLRLIQGGKDNPSPAEDERYHLSKSEYDQFKALFYKPATIGIGSNISIFERGTTAVVTINGSAQGNSDTIVSTSLTQNGTEVSINNATSFSRQFSISSQNTFVYKAVKSDGSVIQSSVTISPVLPIFVGSFAGIPTPSQILGLTKLIQTRGTVTYNFNATAQNTHIAYPATYGPLTSILDVNGFQILPSYQQAGSPRTITLDLPNGVGPNQYLLYSSNQPLTLVSFKEQFIF